MNRSAIWPGHRNDKWPGDQSVVPGNLWVGALEAVTTQQGASLIAAIIPPLIAENHSHGHWNIPTITLATHGLRDSASNSCGARGAFTGHFCGAGHAPIGEPRNNGVFGA